MAFEALDDGDTFVNGKDSETARLLLRACDDLGIPQEVVKTADRGFYVPHDVYDQMIRTLDGRDPDGV